MQNLAAALSTARSSTQDQEDQLAEHGPDATIAAPERELAQELRELMAVGRRVIPPPLPPLDPDVTAWIRQLTGAPVRTPAFEAELARRTIVDLFGLLDLPPAPAFLDGCDPGALPPELAAPFLRRLSMTRPAPTPADLIPAALAADPGLVTRVARDPHSRHWDQAPAAGAPLLPAEVSIPHLVHVIWLGGPVPENTRLRRIFGYAADRFHDEADFVVWTDVPRAAFTAAETVPPPGAPDPHAAVRSMLTWARGHGIHLINVHEVFHASHPMTLHAPFTAEMAKQLPRGYAGASDHLRLDIIHTFGGAYTDGDNYLGTTPDGTPLPASLTSLFHNVASSPHAFALHVIPEGINNDIVIAPPRHPVITLWRELARANYWDTQPELYSGLPDMQRRYARRPVVGLLRYSVVFRSGRVHHRVRKLLDINTLDDPRLVRVSSVIRHGSELSWTSDKPPVPVTPARARDTTARVITTLARQLFTREGDLHLTGVAPVIAALPDPDAVWTATLTILAELIAAGAVPPVTSVTRFRWSDNGAPQHAFLPPEAEALLDRDPAPGPWLGRTIAAPGDPAWILDEAVTPGRLLTHPAPPPPLSSTTTHHHNATAVYLGTPPLPGPPAPPTIPGHTTVTLHARNGQAWAGAHPLTPEDLALHLHHLGLTHQPLLLATTPDYNPHSLRPFADQLQKLHPHPILTTETPGE